MAELCIEFLMVGFGVRFDLFGCGFQVLKMRSRVVVAEGVIRNDGEALSQKGLEFGVHQVEELYVLNFKLQARGVA